METGGVEGSKREWEMGMEERLSFEVEASRVSFSKSAITFFDRGQSSFLVL